MTLATTKSAEFSVQRTLSLRGVKTAVVTTTLLLAQLPLLWLYAQELWGREHYQFYPLLLIAVGLLAWQRWPRSVVAEESGSPRRSSRSANMVLLGALAMLVVATLIFSHLLAAVAAVLVIGAVVVRFGGRRAWGAMFAVWALLWLVVPLPMGMDFRLITKMQSFTALASSQALEVFGIHHVLEGNIIELPSQRLFVEEACSGVQSLFALISATALFVVWTRRPFLHSGMLLVSAAFWAGIGNIARIVTIVLVLNATGTDLTVGWQHQALGLVEFALALMLVASTDQWLGWLLAPVEDVSPFEEEQSRLTQGWNVLVGWGARDVALAGGGDRCQVSGVSGEGSDLARRLPKRQFDAFASLLVASVFLVIGGAQLATINADSSSPVRSAAAAVELSEESLPVQQDQWRRVEFDTVHRADSSAWGEYSKIWEYASPQGGALVSCDYPFSGWHSLVNCYESQGWRIESRQLLPYPDLESSSQARFVEIEMQNPEGRYGHLLYGLFDASGRDLIPDGHECPFFQRVYFRLRDGLDRGPFGALSGTKISRTPTGTYQIQLLSTSLERFGVERKEELREQFVAFRAGIQRNWKD